MSILITGGAGFIGSNLVDRLLSLGHSIIAIDNFDDFYSKEIKIENLKNALLNKNFIFYNIDIREKEKIELLFKNNKNIEIVIHLAAKAGVRPSILNPKEYIDVNIGGTLNLLQSMNQYNIKKLIFASSSSVYGNNINVPFKEDDFVDHPISPYAMTKKAGELLTYTFHHLYQFNVINLRFFTVYGPRQRPDLAIHKFFKKINAKEEIELYGDGNTGRDYTYIDDIVMGIIQAIEYNKNNQYIYEIINLGNRNPVKLLELVKEIEKVSNKKMIVKKVEMQDGDVNLTFADISKATNKLGYSPKTSINEGLFKFKMWFDENNR